MLLTRPRRGFFAGSRLSKAGSRSFPGGFRERSEASAAGAGARASSEARLARFRCRIGPGAGASLHGGVEIRRADDRALPGAPFRMRHGVGRRGAAGRGAGDLLSRRGDRRSRPPVPALFRRLRRRRARGGGADGRSGVARGHRPPGRSRPAASTAMDAAGRRLGRGKGHYDATLAAYGGSSVALVFDSQLVPEVPVGEHDRRVGAVCTEARWVSVP